MHSISKKSFVVRVAYGSNPPAKTSASKLFQGFILRGFASIILVVVLVVIAVLVAVIGTPIALLFGHRPAFISFLKTPRINPFLQYDLPTFFGKRAWPIFPISFIVLGIMLRNVDYIFQPAYMSFGKDVICFMLLCGPAGILFIVLQQFESWRKFLSRIKSWWEEKGCIKLDVVE